MEPYVKKYSLKDSSLELQEKEEWQRQSYEYKIGVLELLRRLWAKIDSGQERHGSLEGFRRVFRITKQS